MIHKFRAKTILLIYGGGLFCRRNGGMVEWQIVNLRKMKAGDGITFNI